METMNAPADTTTTAPVGHVGSLLPTHTKEHPLVLGPCTLYLKDDVVPGFAKVETRHASVWLAPYAQHAVAVHVEFVPKRGRRAVRVVKLPDARVLCILPGWGHPDPDGLWDESTRRVSSGVESMRGRYGSCDPRWSSDLARKLARYCVRTGVWPVVDVLGVDLTGVLS